MLRLQPLAKQPEAGAAVHFQRRSPGMPVCGARPLGAYRNTLYERETTCPMCMRVLRGKGRSGAPQAAQEEA